MAQYAANTKTTVDTTGFAVAPGLALPLDADARRMAILGMPGSGKTTGAKVIVEHLIRAGRRIAILDPQGVWHGLKTAANGTDAGLPVVVFGGRYADVPLQEDAGAAVADLVMESHVPVILDLSGFEDDSQMQRVTADFVKRLRTLQSPEQEPILLVVDEADLLAPQVARKGHEGESKRAIVSVARRSRSDGLGLLVITQRPVGLSTDILNMVDAVFLLRFAGYNDLARVEELLGSFLDRQMRDEVLKCLPSSPPGRCYVCSPAWMEMGQFFQFPLPATYDSSATPTAGQARPAQIARADVDIAALSARFAAAIAEEAENDPERLRQQIASLRNELSSALKVKSAPIDVPTAPIEYLRRLHGAITLLSDLFIEYADKIGPQFGNQQAEIIDMLSFVATKAAPSLVIDPQPFEIAIPKEEEDSPELPPVVRQSPPSPSNLRLSGAQQKIVNALGQFRSMGLHAVDRANLAIYSGSSPKSGSFGKNLSDLKIAGYIDYPSGGKVALTESGRARSVPAPKPATLRDLHDGWCRFVPSAQGRILRYLLQEHPAAKSRAEVASAVSSSPTSGSFGKNLGDLRLLGAIDYPRPGMVVATPLLFPKGLA